MYILDVNECDNADLNDCDDFKGECRNIDGGFKCSCVHGTVGDGKTCTGNVHRQIWSWSIGKVRSAPSKKVGV